MLKDSEPKIALFIDYDNIAIGLKDAGSQVFDVNRVMRRLLDKGRIIFKRAYADWSLFTTHKQPLHEAGIEMIDIPMRRSIGKNSADIRLVVDALDLCYTKEHIDTFVIGSGDSDFSPLVSKLKENDKQVIGFGLRSSTSHLLADNCDEFLFYEDLVELPSIRPPLPPGLTRRQQEAFTLLLDSIASLMRENKDVLWGSLVKDAIRRKHPSFNEQRYGYNTFSNLLEDAAGFGLVGLVRDPKSGGTPVITGFGTYNGEAGSFAPSSGGAAPAAAKGPSLLVQRDGGVSGTQAGASVDQDRPVRMGKAGSTPMRKERLFAPKPATKRASTKSAKDAEEEARSKRGEAEPVKTAPATKAEPQPQKPEAETPQEQSKITSLEPAKKPEPKKAPKTAAESRQIEKTETKAEKKVEAVKDTEKAEKEDSQTVSKPVKKTPARKPRRATKSTSKTSDKETTAEVKATEEAKPAESITEEEPGKKAAKPKAATTRKRATRKSTAAKKTEKKVEEKNEEPKVEAKVEPKEEPRDEVVKADVAPKVKATKPVRKTARKTSPRTKTARAKKTEEVSSSSSSTSEQKTASPSEPTASTARTTPATSSETGSAKREPGSPENRKTTSTDIKQDKKEPSTPSPNEQSVVKVDQVESSPAAADTPAQSESTSSGVKPLRSMGRVRKR